MSHDTPAAVTSSNRETPENSPPGALLPEEAAVKQVTSPQVTPVTTEYSSPVMESTNISLEYSQPSSPEEDNTITKGFEEVCQVSS